MVDMVTVLEVIMVAVMDSDSMVVNTKINVIFCT